MRLLTIMHRRKLIIVKLNQCRRNLLSQNNRKIRICIVGAGAAGFYAAHYILKNLTKSYVDVIEKLPVPFGLVRFGVAPDHPEVKNVIKAFLKTAENSNFRFLGNLCLGKDFTLKDLRERYNAVLLAYGAEKDRKLDIENENGNNVISAREFVAWYNGLPGYQNLNPNLNTKTVAIIGQGNVAIDVARILISPLDKLKTTDTTEYALDGLSKSKVEKVYMIGRRGPLQAAFTTKELREMLKLPGVRTIWRREDFKDCTSNVISTLDRQRKRLTELMLQSLEDQSYLYKNKFMKEFHPIFMRSLISINQNSIELGVNEVIKDEAIPTGATEIIETNLILKSIGFQSVNVDSDLNFDERKGLVRNIRGKVLKKNSDAIDKGLYVAGWLATGPLGVILTTMHGAFSVANIICEDIKSGRINNTETKPGLDIDGKRVVTWDGWKKIDAAERESGKKLGKPREKIVSIEEMLKIAGV